MGDQGRIKKGKAKHINKNSVSPSQYEIPKKKMHFAELLISLREYNQYDWKISPKEVEENIIA